MEASVSAANQTPAVYVVGGAHYVVREIKRHLTESGIHFAGSALAHFKPPFAPPRYTTHLLVVEDEVNPQLRDHARHLARTLHLGLIEGPARNHWSEVEQQLIKEGLVGDPITEHALAKANEPPHVTIGDAVAAKAEERQEQPKQQEPTPPPATEPAAQEEDMAADPRMQLAMKLLRESKGEFPNVAIIKIVKRDTGQYIGQPEVAKLRKHLGYKVLPPGARPPEVRAALAKYGINGPSREEVSQKGGRAAQAAYAARSVQAKNGATKNGNEAEPAPDELREAVVATLKHIEDVLVGRFHLATLKLPEYRDGHWLGDPEIERITVMRSTISIKH